MNNIRTLNDAMSSASVLINRISQCCGLTLDEDNTLTENMALISDTVGYTLKDDVGILDNVKGLGLLVLGSSTDLLLAVTQKVLTSLFRIKWRMITHMIITLQMMIL